MYEISKIGLNNINCEQFENIFMLTLNKHAPSKIRYVRANNSPFMNNDIYKAIMVRSRLRNILKIENGRVQKCIQETTKSLCVYYKKSQM